MIGLVQSFVFLSSDATMPLDGGLLIPMDHPRRLRLDVRSRRVWVRDEEIIPPLSAPQFKLLHLLYEQPGRVVTRQDLVNVVWGEEESVGVSEQAVDALVRRLRDRLFAMDASHNYIVTLRGHGLRLDNPE